MPQNPACHARGVGYWEEPILGSNLFGDIIAYEVEGLRLALWRQHPRLSMERTLPTQLPAFALYEHSPGLCGPTA
jgi:hypothetical protein